MPDDAPVISAVLWELSGIGWIIWPSVRGLDHRPFDRRTPRSEDTERVRNHNRGGSRPSLRTARNRIRNRSSFAAPQFWQPLLKGNRRAQQTLNKTGGVLRQPGSNQASNDYRGVMWPDRAAVITQRCISGVSDCHRAQAQSRIQSWTCYQLGDQQFLIGVHNAGTEQVADVAGQRVDWALVTIQCERGIAILTGSAPEAGAEPMCQFSGPGPVAVCSRAAERIEQSRTVNRCLVRVTLHLADGNRSLGDPSVVETD